MIKIAPTSVKLDFCDVLLVPRVTNVGSRQEVNLEKNGSVPIIVSNMDNIGTFEIANVLKKHKMMVAILKDYSAEDWKNNIEKYNLNPKHLIPSIGVQNFDDELKKIREIVKMFPSIPFVCLDVANGYMQRAADAVAKFKQDKDLHKVKLAAGNVVTPEGVEHLASAGASLIKLGIGSGGVCLTRDVTGIGYPQLSTIMECHSSARARGVELISDGGIVKYGDFAKAFAAGADYVMAGSIFAGHTETGSKFHGMSSDVAQRHRNNEAPYRASEGRVVELEDRGLLDNTLSGILGGLRSSCSYLGVKNLTSLKTTLIEAIQVNRQINPITGQKDSG